MAKMILNRSLCKHMKAYFPLLNQKRVWEMVLLDQLYAKVCDIKNNVICCHVFCTFTTGCINIKGPKKGKDGYLNAYLNFCCKVGIPSILARDNAQEQKSNKVTNFNLENHVKDFFLEVNNQQQNPVESGAIKWLKPTIQKVLDI